MNNKRKKKKKGWVSEKENYLIQLIESTRGDCNPLKLHVQALGPDGLKFTPI